MLITLFLAGCAEVANESVPDFQGGRYAFATTGTNGSAESYRRDPATGALTFIDTLLIGTEPRRIVVDHSSRLLYVAMSGETDLRGLRIDPNTGTLTDLGVDVACGFDLAIHPSRNLLYCASGPDINHYQVDSTTGTLTGMGTASQGTSLSGMFVTPDGRFLYATDFSEDVIYGFVLSPSTGFASTPTPTVSFGTDAFPINAAFDPLGRFFYVANQSGDTVTAYSINGNGDLTPAGSVSATGPQALTVSADGTVLYVAASGSNELQRYDINQSTGGLSFVASISRSGAPLAPTVTDDGNYLYVGQETGPGIGLYGIGSGGSLTFIADHAGASGGQIWGILPVDVH